jgi:hypothetical protein
MTDISQEAREDAAWSRGYLIAVSTMLDQHGCTVTAKDALLDSGISWSDVKALKLNEFDLRELGPGYAEIALHKKQDAQAIRNAKET